MSKIAQARWYGSDIGRWRLQMPTPFSGQAVRFAFAWSRASGALGRSEPPAHLPWQSPSGCQIDPADAAAGAAVGALGVGVATNNNGLSEAQAVTSQVNEINYLEGVS
jgi:hypothetical protein